MIVKSSLRYTEFLSELEKVMNPLVLFFDAQHIYVGISRFGNLKYHVHRDRAFPNNLDVTYYDFLDTSFYFIDKVVDLYFNDYQIKKVYSRKSNIYFEYEEDTTYIEKLLASKTILEIIERETNIEVKSKLLTLFNKRCLCKLNEDTGLPK